LAEVKGEKRKEKREKRKEKRESKVDCTLYVKSGREHREQEK
jgi:hypothetical protein